MKRARTIPDPVVEAPEVTEEVDINAAAAADAAATMVEAEAEAEAAAPEAVAPEATQVEAVEPVDAAAPEPGPEDEAPPAVDSAARLENIVESLLFASDRPLMIADLKRLLGERDAKKVTAALDALKTRHEQTGIQLASVAGGFQFRTHPENGAWVSKLVAGRPQRLSRALLETLSIVAYRQPVTRPEIDEVRGVDCGPVLKTLLDRGLVRMIGKKEDVGRPILYGTTPEFLRTFSLRDLNELPTLREFHELGEAEKAEVEARTQVDGGSKVAPPAVPAPAAPEPRAYDDLPDEEEDGLMAELERASTAAADALGPAAPEADPTVPSTGAPDAS